MRHQAGDTQTHCCVQGVVSGVRAPGPWWIMAVHSAWYGCFVLDISLDSFLHGNGKYWSMENTYIMFWFLYVDNSLSLTDLRYLCSIHRSPPLAIWTASIKYYLYQVLLRSNSFQLSQWTGSASPAAGTPCWTWLRLLGRTRARVRLTTGTPSWRPSWRPGSAPPRGWRGSAAGTAGPAPRGCGARPLTPTWTISGVRYYIEIGIYSVYSVSTQYLLYTWHGCGPAPPAAARTRGTPWWISPWRVCWEYIF